MRLTNRIKFVLIAALLLLLIVPIYTFSIFIHELGHALAVIVSGGEVIEFVVRIDGGYVRHISQAGDAWIIALMGGMFQGVFFFQLAKKIPQFNFSTIICFAYGIGEAMNMPDTVVVIFCNLIFAGVVFGMVAAIYKVYDFYFRRSKR